MFRRLAYLALLSATTLSATNWWYPYAEVRGRGGDYREGAMLHGFAPIMQNEKSILFTEARGGQLRYQTTAGLGGGYRHLIGCNSFIGIAGFFDWSRSSKHFDYVQATASAELVLKCAELRANVYLPTHRTGVIKTLSVTDEMIIDDVQVIDRRTTDQRVQQGYSGFDLEGGISHDITCTSRIRAYCAYYQYQRAGLRDIQGPRLRLRFEHDNLCMCGTRLIAEGIYQYDTVRGGQAEGMLGFRIPFCRPNCCCLPPALRRMNDLVERDLGIILRNNDRQLVEEELITQLFFFAEGTMGAGTQTDPTNVNVVEVKSTPGDILFALNDFGPISLDFDQLVLKSAQQLYGFDSQPFVDITLPNGAILTVFDLTAAGQAELVQPFAHPVVTANNSTTIFGVKLTNGTIGIDIDGVEDVLINKVDICQPSMAGIRSTTSTDVDILASTITTTGAKAVEIFAGGDINIDTLTATTTTGTLFDVSALSAPLTIDMATLTSTTGNGVWIANGTADGAVTMTMTNSTLAHAGSSIFIDNTLAPINLAGLTVTNTNAVNKIIVDVQDTQTGPITLGPITATGYSNNGQVAVSLTGNTAPITFANLDVMGTGGTGIFASNNTSLITVPSGTFDITNRPGLDITSSSLALTFDAMTVTTSNNDGWNLNGVMGTVTVTGNTFFDRPSQQGVEIVNSSNIALNFNGNLTVDTPGSQGINWVGTSGSLQVMGDTLIDSAGSTGISFNNSTNYDFDFAKLDILNSARGFDVRNSSGNVTVTGVALIDQVSTDGIRVRISADADFDFQDDLTINGNAGAAGIVYNSSSTGSLSVAATTTIDNFVDGIRIDNADDVVFMLDNLDISTIGNGAIEVRSSSADTSITAADVTITDAEIALNVTDANNAQFAFNSLTATMIDDYGVYWDTASGILTVTGATSIGGLASNVSTPAGISILDNSAFDFDFQGLTIDGNNATSARGISIESSTGTLDATAVIISNVDQGLSVNNASPVITFASLTVNPTEDYGIFYDSSGGSLTVTGPTIIDGLLSNVANPSGIQVVDNSTIDFNFADITIDGNNATDSWGIYLQNTGGKFDADDVVVGNLLAGLLVDTSSVDVTMATYTADPVDARGVFWTGSTGELRIPGLTSINVMTPPADIPRGFYVINSAMDVILGDVEIEMNNVVNSTAFDIALNTGTFVANDVVVTDAEWGLVGTSAGAITFNDFTVQPDCRFGIDWRGTGSFTAADVDIQDVNDVGIRVNPGASPVFNFDNLSITEPVLGISFEAATGSLTVTEVTSIVDASNNAINVSSSPNDVDMTFTTLNIDFDNVGGGNGVFLANNAGDFTVTTSGHILHQLAGVNVSGVAVQDCSGNVSISGSMGDRFEIAGAGTGGAAGPYGGVIVTSTGSGNLENLTLDYVNIHDIGAGANDRRGIAAYNIVDEVAITNSVISDIDGAYSPAIEIGNTFDPNPPSGIQTVTVQNNEIFGATDFSTTLSAVDVWYGESDPTNQLIADISNNHIYQVAWGPYVGLFQDAGTNAPNRVEIHDNNIHDVGGPNFSTENSAIWLEPSGSTKSIICIKDNTINAETNAPVNQADYGIYIKPISLTTAAYDVQLTIEGNSINPASTSSFQRDGIFIRSVANANTRNTTVLIDSNTINDVVMHGVNIEARGNETTTVTLTNNTSNGDAVAESLDSSTLNVLFGDPSSPGTNGNDFATQYGLTQTGGTFNLGSTGGAANATDAVTNLGNTTGGGAPTVNTAGVINLIDANTTNFPQPMPCP